MAKNRPINQRPVTPGVHAVSRKPESDRLLESAFSWSGAGLARTSHKKDLPPVGLGRVANHLSVRRWNFRVGQLPTRLKALSSSLSDSGFRLTA